jgi:hypothetical protein
MDDFQNRIEKMGKAISPYAKAKAERVYIENFLRSKKCLLMSQSEEKTISGKEMYAYAHPEYIELTEALKEAVEIEEKCKWALEKFKIEFEHWRTCQANDRWQKDRV